AVAGAGDMLSGLGRSTIWNQTVPDELRGRLAGIEVLSYSVGPQLGQVRAGAMAGWTGARPAVWTGALACVAAVRLLAAVPPRLGPYDAPTDEGALRRRAPHLVASGGPGPAHAAAGGPGPAGEAPATPARHNTSGAGPPRIRGARGAGSAAARGEDRRAVRRGEHLGGVQLRMREVEQAQFVHLALEAR